MSITSDLPQPAPRGKYVWFRSMPSGARKTSVWEVCTISGNTPLGIVAFWPRWRKYTFQPNKNTVYEQDCLRDIAAFCEQASAGHRCDVSARRAAAEQGATAFTLGGPRLTSLPPAGPLEDDPR